jgi:hypothetical protein
MSCAIGQALPPPPRSNSDEARSMELRHALHQTHDAPGFITETEAASVECVCNPSTAELAEEASMAT